MAGSIKPNQALARAVFQDGVRSNSKNGAPTRSGVPGVLADVITARQHEGRPYGHFWGGQVTADLQPLNPAMQMLRLNTLEGGCKSPRGVMYAIFGAGLASADTGFYAQDGTLNKFPGSSFSQVYPEQVFSYPISPDPTTDTAVPSGEAEEQTIGTDSIILTSGVLFDNSVLEARPEDCITRDGFVPGADVIATKTGSRSTNARLIDRFEQVWQNNRPQIQWSSIGGTWCDFTEDPQQFRFWGNQTIGDGGTAPSLNGPGITLFGTRYAGAGLRDTVRVYVSVYAAMSGATDQGEIAIANRDTSGAMQPFAQIGSSGMISGTGFQWYPATGSAFDPATAPYFEAPTNQVYDRVLLGARSTGATDTVRIGAWHMAIYHSVA
jgi:hypothetical protein